MQESSTMLPQPIQIMSSETNIEDATTPTIKNTTSLNGDESPNISSIQNNYSEGRNTGKELGIRLLKLNKKVLEPILKDLEVANLVFSSVNVSTKKALKEFVFLKQKEQIEREQIKRILEERNAQLLNEKKNRKRNIVKLPLKQEQASAKLDTQRIETPKPKQVDVIPEPTPQPKKNSTVSQKKVTSTPTTVSSAKKVSKVAIEKTAPVETVNPKVSNQKKKLEDILAMARKIRTREEESTKPKENDEKTEPIQLTPQILSEETEEVPEESVSQPEEEPKLSFITIDERFQHYVSILKSFSEANEKSEELSAKLSKKSGWKLTPPKQLHTEKPNVQTKLNLLSRYNTLITRSMKSKDSFNDVEDFKNRFCYNEEEMHQLEEELLQNTKEKRKPEITPTNIIYSDIPNSYISRWLPKRVNKQTTQTIVPYKDLSKKFDKRRARFPCRLFNFKNKKQLENIYRKRFEVQQLMLKNHLYNNVFKGDYNLLNYLPQLKEEGQDDTYYKLLRCLEGIIPCEALRNESHRNIINWKSFYNFLPSSNSCSNSVAGEEDYLESLVETDNNEDTEDEEEE